MSLIVADGSTQGDAATFRGTRILVHQIANLLAQRCKALTKPSCAKITLA